MKNKSEPQVVGGMTVRDWMAVLTPEEQEIRLFEPAGGWRPADPDAAATTGAKPGLVPHKPAAAPVANNSAADDIPRTELVFGEPTPIYGGDE